MLMTHLLVLLFHLSIVAVIDWPIVVFTSRVPESFTSCRKILKSGSFLIVGCLASLLMYRSRSRHLTPTVRIMHQSNSNLIFTNVLPKTISFCFASQFCSHCVHGVLLWWWWYNDAVVGVVVDKLGMKLHEVFEPSVHCVLMLRSSLLSNFGLNS